MSTAAVLLAAGGSTRFGDGNKLLVPFRGRPLIEWAVDAALGAGLDDTVVITGAASLSLRGVRIVANPRWPGGIATSLQTAIAACGAYDAIVVGMGDTPFVTSETWRAVAASESPVAVATYEGRRGNPVRLAKQIWPLLPTEGDEGARRLMHSRPDLVAEVPCMGERADIDTVEDLERWS